jgi:hypothetical protein
MKIKTNSWHYRLLDSLDFDHPTNLCSYFWKTVWAIVFLAGAVSLSLFVFFVLIVAPYLGEYWWHGLVVHGAIAAIVGAVFGSLALKDRVVNSEPGLVRAKYRAWKDGYCPRLEFDHD